MHHLQEGGRPIFHGVLVKKAYYRALVLKSPGNEGLIKILSGAPQDGLTIPISIRDRAGGSALCGQRERFGS